MKIETPTIFTPSIRFAMKTNIILQDVSQIRERIELSKRARIVSRFHKHRGIQHLLYKLSVKIPSLVRSEISPLTDRLALKTAVFSVLFVLF